MRNIILLLNRLSVIPQLAANIGKTDFGAASRGRSERRRLMAMLRMACRLLGLKRNKGPGLPAYAAAALAMGVGLAQQAIAADGDGIFINPGSGLTCGLISMRPTPVPLIGTVFVSPPVLTNVAGVTSNCSPDTKGTQTDRVLFYNSTPNGLSSNSLTLGGELYVNGGFIGLNNQTTKSMAIGDAATQALGYGSIAFGNNARSTSQGNISIGRNAQTGYISTGPGLPTDKDDTLLESIAIGANAQAIEEFSVALGRYAVTEDKKSFATALGANSIVKVGGGVALGAGAVSEEAVAVGDVTINGKPYTFAGIAGDADPAGAGKGTAVQGTVSIGRFDQRRQLTNMAAGRISNTSTDGINGSQLFATNSAVGTLGDRVTVNEGDIIKNTRDITTNTGNITNIINGKAGLVQQAVPGANITVAAGLDGAAVDIAGTTAGKKGPRRLINLDTGVDATDAVNVGQLTTVDNKVAGHETRITKNEGNITSITNNVGNLTDRAVQYDGKIGDPKTRITLLGAGGTTIGNLANGKIAIDSLEAVNGSQLFGVSNSAATILGGGAAVNPDGTIKSPAYTIQNTTVHTVAEALGHLDTQVTTNTGAINTINTNIGSLKNDALLWDATTNAFSANHGGAGPNKIANVKAGENDTDAVNVGQLSGLKDAGTAAVKSLADRSLQYSWTDTNNNSLVDQGEVDYTKSKLRGQDSSGKDVGTTIGNLANGKIAIDSLEAVNGSQLFGVSNSTATILGGGAAVNPDGTIKSPTYTIQNTTVNTVEAALRGLDTQVTTNTGAITTINTNIGNLKNDALLWDATTNAFSANHGGAGPNKIANVKAGENDTDAVNFGQLRGLATTGKSLGDVAVKYAWDDKNGNGELDPGEIVDYSKIKLAGAGATGTVISNLANGRVAIDSLDAVNGSQLWSTSNSFATFLGGGAAISGGLLKGPTYNIASIAGDGTTGAVNVFTNVGDALGGLNSNITNVNDLVANLNTRFEASRLDALRWDEGKKSFTAVHGGGGGGTKIAPVNPVASGTNKITDLQAGDVNPTSTDAVNGSQLHDTNQKIAVLDENAVKYKLNPDGSKTNEVSLQGADPNAPVLISNLQAGKADNDAVNVRQLKAETANLGNVYLDQSKAYTNTVTANTLNQSTSYTDSKITNVNGRIDKLTTDVNDGFARLSSDIGVARKEAYQAAAIGLAASSLRYDSTPGKLSVAMGGGVWRDQAAMAFGAGYTSESGKVRANVTGAASDGQVGVGAGVSFTLN